MKIAVMGYGTIGSGVVEVLEINKEKIAKRAGEPIEVKYVLDLREFPGTPIENKIVHDYKVIAEDPEIGIVVETKTATTRFSTGSPRTASTQRALLRCRTRWTTTLRWSRSAALTPHHGGRALPHRRAGRVTPPRPSTRTRPCASAGCTPAE